VERGWARPTRGASAYPFQVHSDLADIALDALDEVTVALPGGGERREGQRTMVVAVADAIAGGTHVVVQAGTGTGKSLGYLVPSLLSGRRVVVATATKALQDQLATKDLPFLARHLTRPFTFAVLKGRSNYLCKQRLAELATSRKGGVQTSLDGLAADARPEELATILAWANETETGDRAELDIEPSGRTWAAVSVGLRECPGATRCPNGGGCFAELARRSAADADVVVVNLHLLAIDLALDGGILPEHDVVVIDEAHQTEDIVAEAAGTELTGGRFAALARITRGVLSDEKTCDDVETAGDSVVEALVPLLGTRIPPLGGTELERVLSLARDRVERLSHALRGVPDTAPGDIPARKLRAVQAATALLVDIDTVNVLPDTHVAWVEGRPDSPALRLAPIDVSEVLRKSLWNRGSVILTSATLPPNVPQRLGLDDLPHKVLDVGSPFDFEANAILYCAVDLPEPRSPQYREALHRELESLIVAAGGRTLALFTSWKAMNEAVSALRHRLPWPVLAQGELPKTRLLEQFSADRDSCLFATMSFWQGVDVPGNTLSLVVIDRIPFPRPDDPLLQARRELAGPTAFRTIDVPRAAVLLAQGAGRLIRNETDRGVVAVLDSRLANNKSYRWDIVKALPPMRRSRDRAEVEAFLRTLRDS
jgi:ATP-dependent DNA helicase DinG